MQFKLIGNCKMKSLINIFCLIICVKAKIQYVQYDFNDLDQFQPTFYKR